MATQRSEREAWDTEFAVKHGLFGFDAFNQATDPEFAEAWRQFQAWRTVKTEQLIMAAVEQILSEMEV